MDEVASCVWLVTPELVLALDERLGEPLDTYVNGSQVWLRDEALPDGSQVGGVGIEWRLHPVAGYRRPTGIPTEEVFAATVYGLRADIGEHATNATEPADQAAPDHPASVDPAALWAGLEAFPCDGDEVEPAPLAAACRAVLGIAPDAFGIVDHTSVGDQWERTLGREVSVIDLLLRQLDSAG